jgi:hypothetical protein
MSYGGGRIAGKSTNLPDREERTIGKVRADYGRKDRMSLRHHGNERKCSEIVVQPVWKCEV